MYLQVQKEIREIQGCKCIFERCTSKQKDEKVGVVKQGTLKETEAPKQSVLLHFLEQSLGVDGHPGPEGHFSASENIDLLYSTAAWAGKQCLWVFYALIMPRLFTNRGRVRCCTWGSAACVEAAS